MATFNRDSKVWSGPKVPPLYNPDQNLGQLILRVLEQTPDTITQISADTDVSVICGEMRERTLKIATHLNGLELKQGDVVGVVAANTENLAPTVFACFLLGLPVNPLAPIMVESDIVQMYSKTKPKIIFCDGSNLKTVQNAVNAMKSKAKIYTIMEKNDGYECISEVLKVTQIIYATFDYPKTDPSSIALILCSSGSTGFPKGICKSHSNVIMEFRPSSDYNPNGKNSIFQFSAIFWYTGSFFMILGTLNKYTRIITTRSFDPQFMLEVIRKYNVTHVFSPPYGIVNLLQLDTLKPLASIKYWMVGGSAVSRDLCDKFKPFIPNGVMGVVYGSTEQGIVTVNKSGSKFGSSGRTAGNTHIKVTDDQGNALDNNKWGEIWAKISSKFLGYLGEPDKTRDAYEGEWFKTGDIGYFDDDGYIFIVDRKKELLKYQNYQVTPSELEAVINEIEGVVSSCVVGVPQENTGNDIIHAFVIAGEASGLTEERVLNYVNGKVIDAKKLRGGVHFVSSFEVGLTGKIDRSKMKRIAAGIN